MQIFPRVSDQPFYLRTEENFIFGVVSLGFEFVHWPLALPAHPLATLVTPERGTGLLKPGTFVERKEQACGKSRESWFALFSLTVAKRRRVCSVSHTFRRNRIWRESVGRGSVGNVGLLRVMWEDI